MYPTPDGRVAYLCPVIGSPQSRQRLQGKKAGKKRGQRATSNIFAMFDQAQIQEFKEASALELSIHSLLMCDV